MDRKAACDAMEGRATRLTHFGGLETRTTPNAILFRGVASSTDSPYEMHGYTETVLRGAFDKTLASNPDVVLNLNHGDSGSGLPLARTTNGSLTLRATDEGLVYEATCDPDDPDAKLAARKIDQGLLNQNSFAFRVVRQRWNDDYTERNLVEVNIHRGDVSIVTNGANPNTPLSVSARQYAQALAEVRAGKTISAQTADTLSRILSLVSDADDGVDQAQIMLAGLIGVPNPDDDSQWTDLAAQQQNAAPEPEAPKGLDLDLARAIAWSLRNRA